MQIVTTNPTGTWTFNSQTFQNPARVELNSQTYEYYTYCTVCADVLASRLAPSKFDFKASLWLPARSVDTFCVF